MFSCKYLSFGFHIQNQALTALQIWFRSVCRALGHADFCGSKIKTTIKISISSYWYCLTIDLRHISSTFKKRTTELFNRKWGCWQSDCCKILGKNYGFIEFPFKKLTKFHIYVKIVIHWKIAQIELRSSTSYSYFLYNRRQQWRRLLLIADFANTKSIITAP